MLRRKPRGRIPNTKYQITSLYKRTIQIFESIQIWCKSEFSGQRRSNNQQPCCVVYSVKFSTFCKKVVKKKMILSIIKSDLTAFFFLNLFEYSLWWPKEEVVLKGFLNMLFYCCYGLGQIYIYQQFPFSHLLEEAAIPITAASLSMSRMASRSISTSSSSTSSLRLSQQ